MTTNVEHIIMSLLILYISSFVNCYLSIQVFCPFLWLTCLFIMEMQKFFFFTWLVGIHILGMSPLLDTDIVNFHEQLMNCLFTFLVVCFSKKTILILSLMYQSFSFMFCVFCALYKKSLPKFEVVKIFPCFCLRALQFIAYMFGL